MMASLAISVPYTGLLFALLGLMSTALPFGLYTTGLQHMEAGRALSWRLSNLDVDGRGHRRFP